MFAPTDEQHYALGCYRTADDLVIEAAAGAGKTSTLEYLARYAPNRRGMYLAFNRVVANEAKARFSGTGVQALTLHALALRSVPNFFGEKLNRSNRFSNWGVVAKAIGIEEDFRFTAADARFVKRVKRETLTRSVKETTSKFMRSADAELGMDHVSLPANLVVSENGRLELSEYILQFARLLWEDYRSPNGQLPLVHDAYLKHWQLSSPVLPVDFLFLDEAQDADALSVDVVLRQQNQRVIVGDRNQAIYGWRTGTMNAMDALPNAHVAQLTQSFRFGPRIADEAQKWLDLLGADLRITGTESIRSTVDPAVEERDAVICRTNSGAIVEVFEALKVGIDVGIAGERKAEELAKLAQAAVDLKEGRKTRHAEFQVFDTWDELVDFSNTDDGADLKSLVSIINQHGGKRVVSAVEACDMEMAELVVSTAHISKGLEWGRVHVGDDFKTPRLDQDTMRYRFQSEEARLAYVTVTRAKQALGTGGLAWINDFDTSNIDLD